MERVAAVAWKEVLHLRRDRRTTTLLVAMPAVLLLFYGYALSFDVKHVPLAVVDLDGSGHSRRVRDLFLSGDLFQEVWRGSDPSWIRWLLDRGTAQVALVIPSGFSRDLVAGRSPSLQLVVDGSDARVATVVLGSVRQMATTVAGSPLPLRVSTQVLYNPTLSSPAFLVPGLLTFVMAVAGVTATALALVREKERGTWDTLRGTPLRAGELIAGKTLPYFALGATAAAGCLAVAHGLLGMPLRGSLAWVALVVALFLGCGLGLGVLVSSVAHTQQVAFQLALIGSMLPNVLLSGFVFPISSMPPALRAFTHVVPARYFLAALRQIVLKGAGPDVWWQDLVGLGAFWCAVTVVGTVRTLRSM